MDPSGRHPVAAGTGRPLGLASRYVAEGRADELTALRPRLSEFLLRVFS